MHLKYKIKRAAQQICSLAGPHRWPFSKDQLLILMYHRVLPKEDQRYQQEQPGMLVTPNTFKMHLKVLKKYFQPIHLSEWIHAAIHSRPLPKKAVAITFDDGWIDNYQYAYPLLKEESFPASIFLVSGMVGTSTTFWPEQLIKIILQASELPHNHAWNTEPFQWLGTLMQTAHLNKNKPNIEDIDQLICKAKCFSEKELYEKISAMQKILPVQPTSPEILNWEQAREMSASGLIQYGSHTCNHTRMNTSLTDKVLYSEILNSKKAIEFHLNHPVDLFCYPNGDITILADNIVKKSYVAACTVDPGWNKAANINRHRLKRIAIHDDISNTETAFLARISGWL
ncbi:MAG TPA: hypothetical protein ENJ28_03655 [Gammaproteobacteria bacterium]|nr:hypothetical protein [Gammaproteobacteria bacterium]